MVDATLSKEELVFTSSHFWTVDVRIREQLL